MLDNLTQSQISELNDYLNMWTRTIVELLQKLKDTIPAEGMLGEVHYWRDLFRILDSLSQEVKQP
jgi:cell division FtsZ-interacting protein ZapD